MKLALIVAVSRNGVIGAGGDLVWRISDDLKWFKKVTMGKPIVMGRKTYQSIGRPLPGRDNIVVTRDLEFSAGGVFVARSIKDALTLARARAEDCEAGEVCIIGGGEVYKQTVAIADRIYMTRIAAEVEGDVFFPALDSAQWDDRHCGSCEKNQQNEFACDFVILDRRGE